MVAIAENEDATPAQLRVQASRASQGYPPTVGDLTALAQMAEVIVVTGGEEEPAPLEPDPDQQHPVSEEFTPPVKEPQHPGKPYGCKCEKWFARRGYWSNHVGGIVKAGGDPAKHELVAEPDPDTKPLSYANTVASNGDRRRRPSSAANGNHPGWQAKNPSPETRLCSMCGPIKGPLPLANFRLKSPAKSQTQYWAYCEDCRAEYQRGHYLKAGQVAIDAEVLDDLVSRMQAVLAGTPIAGPASGSVVLLGTTTGGASIIEIDGELYLAQHLRAV